MFGTDVKLQFMRERQRGDYKEQVSCPFTTPFIKDTIERTSLEAKHEATIPKSS